jgi:hypothetical protein
MSTMTSSFRSALSEGEWANAEYRGAQNKMQLVLSLRLRLRSGPSTSLRAGSAAAWTESRFPTQITFHDIETK